MCSNACYKRGQIYWKKIVQFKTQGNYLSTWTHLAMSIWFPAVSWEIVGHFSLSCRIFPQKDFSTKYHRETLPPRVLALSLGIETIGKHAYLVVIVEFFSFEFNQYLKYSIQDYEIFIIKDNILDTQVRLQSSGREMLCELKVWFQVLQQHLFLQVFCFLQMAWWAHITLNMTLVWIIFCIFFLFCTCLKNN